MGLLPLLIAFVAPAPSMPVPDQSRLIALTSGTVRCGMQVVVPVWREPVVAHGAWVGAANTSGLSPRTLHFRIDAAGRPLTIREERPDGGTYGDAGETEAAFAAWRFAAGAPQGECSVSFTALAYPPDAVPVSIAARYAALPNVGGRGLNVWNTLQPAGSDCREDRPGRLVSVYPDFGEIPEEPGRLAVTFLNFDVAANGRPGRVSVIATSDNAALNRAAVKAIRRWRFVTGKSHHGCGYYFWRGGKPYYELPAAPPIGSFRRGPGTCGPMPEWAHLPPLSNYFPAAFSRRGIEGWAVVRYDVAPWGETGDVEVLASEPADAFGTAAVRLVGSARKEKTARGYVGCVEKVLFKMPSAPDANVQAERG